MKCEFFDGNGFNPENLCNADTNMRVNFSHDIVQDEGMFEAICPEHLLVRITNQGEFFEKIRQNRWLVQFA